MGLLGFLGARDDAADKLTALGRSQAIIAFAPDGTILDANELFLSCFGYARDEVVGRHHSMFVDPAHARGSDYAAFWQQLAAGTVQQGEFRRIGKGGRELWIQGSYAPVTDRSGRVTRVIKVASDITAAKRNALDLVAQMAAISRSQAVIAFEPDGTIIEANENFLATVGYTAQEIVGRHHRIFVGDDAHRADYAQFWERLRAGEFVSGEFRRIGKDGREIWLQASYNPVLDAAGRVLKVIKFATDITERKRAEAVIAELKSSLGRLSEGDLTARIETRFNGEYEGLRQAFNATLERMSDIMGQLRDTARSLRTATGEILTGANDLSERTTRQAAAIAQTSAAMEQLAGTVHDNSTRAEAAADTARTVSSTATEGGDVMRRANEAMAQITSSSARISSIIRMIDDIAFQTNLLALNASVEAARAGDAGRGFAVVAVEVRRLAQSAASASSEVKALIEQSSSEVAGGSKLVAEATDKLHAMLEAARQNAGLVDGIASASRAQAGAIGEITIAVRQMDEMTQHNAALVQETNAAIEQTEAQARELDRVVDVFTFHEEAQAPLSIPQRPMRAPAAREKGGREKAARESGRHEERVRAAAHTYLAAGNAALAQDWSEF